MNRKLALLLTFLAATVPAAAQAGTATPAGTAADCNFDESRTYDRFGDIRIFVKDSSLFACATDVGRAYRLDKRANRRPVFGNGDWVVLAAGSRIRALNVATGRTHGVRTGSAASAVVVNADGTAAWIAGGVLRAKTVSGATRRLATGADAGFLGLELEGCAVTWKAAGEQRSSTIFCANP